MRTSLCTSSSSCARSSEIASTPPRSARSPRKKSLFENAKVRTHVQLIAWRLARARLLARLGSQGAPEALAG